MTRQEPWQDKWIEATDLNWKREGGFATVTRVRRKGQHTEETYALKRLKKTKDTERRRRMYREVVALETHPNPQTPGVIEHNCASYEDTSVPLYAVFEFINGPTLEERVMMEGPLLLEDALAMTERLLDTLETFHEGRYGHRDIKPDNILLRNGHLTNPCLVDFGQTFNLDDTEDALTAASEQVGNRFLWLPEHAPGSANKRDLRSDLTFCVGVFFFALTGIRPSSLLDDVRNLPHQRIAARPVLEAIPEPRQTRIYQVFDRGFQYMLDQRWQSVPSLREALTRVKETHAAMPSLEDQLAFARERAALHNGSKAVLEAIDVVGKRLKVATEDAARRLGDGYRSSVEWRIPTVDAGEIWSWIRCGIDAYTAGKIINTRLRIVGVGSEVVVEELFDLKPSDVRGRLPVSNPNADPDFNETFVTLIVGNVVRGLS